MKKIFFAIACLTLCFQSCVVALIGHAHQVKGAEKAYTVENKAFPADFGKNPNEIFMGIKKGKKSYDKYMMKGMEREYTGKFEYVVFARIDDEKYQDKEVYRFYLYYDPGKHVTNRNTNGTYGTTDIYKQFFVYDRLKDTKYATGAEFSHYRTAVRIYIQNLNEQRLLNQ